MLTIKNKTLRTALKILIPFVFIPILAFLGSAVFDEKKHIFVSLSVALLSVVLFVTGFEKKQTGTRRQVLVSIMIALSIVGRLIPFFKPVTAITIITAIYLGGEAGFLVGSFSALLSNFYFGQGPWTPFQMLAWGLIGLFAGFLAKPLQKSKTALIIYGVLSGVAFSFIMDVWTVIWYNGGFNISLYLAALTTAIPHTVLYSFSNFIFLLLLSKPFGEKLNRIKIKYGV